MTQNKQRNEWLAGMFIEWNRRTKGLAESTCREYAKDMAALLAFLERTEGGKSMRLEWVNAAIVETWANTMAEEGHKANTINRAMATCSQLGIWMAKTKLTEGNNMENLTRPRRQKTLPKPASSTDVEAYLSKTPQTRADAETQALVALMTQTGIRISEALGLEYEDIDKANKALTIRGKGGKERRVYYTQQTAARLNTWARGQKTRRGRIFDMTYLEAYTAIRRALPKGRRETTPHQLRHAFATRQLERGTDIMTLAAMMGHEDIATTRRYTQITDSKQRQAFTA